MVRTIAKFGMFIFRNRGISMGEMEIFLILAIESLIIKKVTVNGK